MKAEAKHKSRQYRKRGILVGLCLVLATLIGGMLAPVPASAGETTIKVPAAQGKYQCGSGKNAVKTSINIGCHGTNCKTSNVDGCSALLDALFAIIRFLSAGVGIVVIASVVWAGVQYASARDDPGETSKAKDRIRNSLIALLIFIFGYAILNYIIPAGFFTT
jgi:hypothetical protein